MSAALAADRIALALLLCLPVARASAAPAYADRVLVNGRIITVDERDTVAQAIAIRDGKILAVGSDAEVRALAGPATEVIDLRGRTATPGLIDAHCHFADGGVQRSTLDLSYPEVKSVADAVAALRARAGAAKAGAWIEGRGWDEGKLTERRYILAADIDPVSAGHPVWLTHTTGHYGVANSAALKLAGITRDTPDPAGGTIDRGPDGAPTGVLKESAMALVTTLVPLPSPEQRLEGIRAFARDFNKEGMTGLKDPGIGEDEWEAYQRALGEGALSVRVFALWHGGETPEDARQRIARIGPFTKPYRSTGDDHLVSGGVKLFMDGSGGARTAWLHDEWNKNAVEVDAGNRGYPAADPELRREQIRLYHDAGIHVSTHAVGDRAIDWVVDSYALALEKKPTPGLRHGIIHANIPTEHALDRMAALQRDWDAGFPEPSATFTWWIGDNYAGNFGRVRSLRLNPFRSFVERGIRWAGGSDYYVTPFPARYGLWAAMAREPLLGRYGPRPFGSEQAVDIRTALRSYTIWAARQMFLEKKIGSLEVGKYADIAVWNKDLYAASVAEIKDLECLLTLFQGEVVYRAAASPIR